MTTLTLNIDRDVVAGAEVYAERAQKTVPQLVEEFLLSIGNSTRSSALSKRPVIADDMPAVSRAASIDELFDRLPIDTTNYVFDRNEANNYG